MANIEKQKRIYMEFVSELDNIARGKSPVKLESNLDKAFHLFLEGYNPSEMPQTDFCADNIANLKSYCDMVIGRKTVKMPDCEREFTQETDVLRSLKCLAFLGKYLILPHFSRMSYFAGHVFKEIPNLSLAYLDAIVQSAASQYVPEDAVIDAKKHAVDIAKAGVKIGDKYVEFGPKKTEDQFLNFSQMLIGTSEEFLRPFELVPTCPKKVQGKKTCLASLEEAVTQRDEKGNIAFAPFALLPVALGGNEVGIRLANAYESAGHSPIVYPVMFSVKTRKQRQPWIGNDGRFLRQEVLEGRDLLICEDWVTTGNTVRGVLHALEDVYPHEMRVATLKRDPEKSKVQALNNTHFYVGKWMNYNGNKVDTINQPENTKQ